MEARTAVWLARAQHLKRFYTANSGMEILEINEEGLDKSLLSEDPKSFAFLYRGTIPVTAIRILNEKKWWKVIKEPLSSRIAKYIRSKLGKI